MKYIFFIFTVVFVCCKKGPDKKQEPVNTPKYTLINLDTLENELKKEKFVIFWKNEIGEVGMTEIKRINGLRYSYYLKPCQDRIISKNDKDVFIWKNGLPLELTKEIPIDY